MTKKELAAKLATRHGLTKVKTLEIIDTVATLLTETLVTEGQARLHGFGTFKAYQSAARQGFNPNSKTAMEIPASIRVRFQPVEAVKAALNN